MEDPTWAERFGIYLFGTAYTRLQVATFVLSALVLGLTIAGVGILVIEMTTGTMPTQNELFSTDPPTGSIYPSKEAPS